MNKLVEHRKLWVKCLRGEDYNSIRNQLCRMQRNAAAYRTIYEARSLAPNAEEGGVQLNGMMYGLLDQCFWDSQLLAVRRLNDPSSLRPSNKGKDESVYSLTSLLKDIKEHKALLTRENMFDAEKLEYDLAKIERAYNAYILKQENEGHKATNIPSECSTMLSELRHTKIDQLSGTSTNSRSLTDCIQSSIIENLEMRVRNSCIHLNEFVNKFRAHSATPSSRSKGNTDGFKISLGELWATHETLCRVAVTIDLCLLGTGGSPYALPHPQCDLLEYIEKPLVKSSDVDILYEFWGGLQSETETWVAWEVDDLLDGPSEE